MPIERSAGVMSVSIDITRLSWLLIPMAMVALALTVLYHNRRSSANRSFSIFLFLSASWLLTGFVYFTFPPLIAFLMPVQMILGSAFSFFFYLFTRSFAVETYRLRPADALFALPTAVLIVHAALLAMDPARLAAYAATVRIEQGVLHRDPSPLYAFYSAGILANCLAGLALLTRDRIKTREPLLRRRITVVLLFLAVGLLGGFVLNNVTTLLGLVGYQELSIVPILVALGGVGLSLLRHKAWTVEYLMDLIEQRNRTIESELDMARLIQQKLLPPAMPALPGLDIHALYLPMDKVGGDYYDFRVGETRLDCIIADVTGHGIPGAFLAGITQTGFQFYAEAGTRGGTLLARLDDLIARKSVGGMFVTASLVHLDLASRELLYCRAGHCMPLIHRRRRDVIEELASHGRALGMPAPLPFEERRTTLEPGDRLVLYTDGLVEVRDADGVLFGDARLASTLRDIANLPARDAVEAMVAVVNRFAGGAPMDDDVTMVLIDVL